MAGGACGGAGTPLGVSPRPTLARRVVAEAVGTALLLAAVVGSGIMGERLAAGNVAIAPQVEGKFMSAFVRAVKPARP